MSSASRSRSSTTTSTASVAVSTASTSPAHPGKVVYTGDFSDPAQGWRAESDKNRALSVNGSSYKVELKRPGVATAAPNFNGVALADLVDVAVSTTFQMPRGGVGVRVGVFCRATQGHSYVLAVGPSSTPGQLSWWISRVNAEGSTTQLGSGTTSVQQQPLALEGDCLGGHRDTPVMLALSLNGHVIGQARDVQVPAPFFGLSGVSLTSASTATSATFSTFRVRAAT